MLHLESWTCLSTRAYAALMRFRLHRAFVLSPGHACLQEPVPHLENAFQSGLSLKMESGLGIAFEEFTKHKKIGIKEFRKRLVLSISRGLSLIRHLSASNVYYCNITEGNVQHVGLQFFLSLFVSNTSFTLLSFSLS